jgi:hypothetical protein
MSNVVHVGNKGNLTLFAAHDYDGVDHLSCSESDLTDTVRSD